MPRRREARTAELVPREPGRVEFKGSITLEPYEVGTLSALVERCQSLSLVETDGRPPTFALQSDDEQREADELLRDLKRYLRELDSFEPYRAARDTAKRLADAVRAWRAAHHQVLAGAKDALVAGIATYRRQETERAQREARERAEEEQAELGDEAAVTIHALMRAYKKARGRNRVRIGREIERVQAEAEDESRGASPADAGAQAAAEVSQRFKGGGAVVRTPRAECVNLASLVAAVVASNPALLAEAKRIAKQPTTPPAIPVEVLAPSRATLAALARTYRDRLDLPGVDLFWSEHIRST